MPPTVEDRLQDILEVVAAIDQLVADISLEEFGADVTRRMAIERYLEIACEAAHRLPDEIKQGAPEINWRRMNDFANLLRHAYQSTRADIVWDIVQNHLPPLKSFVERRSKGDDDHPS
jgi:uncharacterized protein with HEPN domain